MTKFTYNSKINNNSNSNSKISSDSNRDAFNTNDIFAADAITNTVRSSRFCQGASIFIMLVLLVGLSLVFSARPVMAEVQINAGYLNYAEDWVELDQGVEIFWEEYETVSQRGEIDRENTIVYLYEEVELFFEGGLINSEEADMYLDDDEFIFRENVFLNYDQGEEASPIELTTAVMRYYPEEENFVFEEELEIEQENRTITAGSGDFLEAEEAFYFADGVEIFEDGDRITSREAVLHMGEDEVFTAEGDVEIELEI